MNNILIEDLVDMILTHPALNDEEKKELLVSLVKKGKITEGFYFHESEEDHDAVEVWFRNTDEYGMQEHGNTGWNDPNAVVEEYLKSKAINAQK